jgi:histidyl-tRNA synthetase
MRVQRCKGTRDLSPEEMSTFRLIDGVFRDSCLKCGYEEVKTPTLEYLHLFTAAGTLTPSMLGKVYSFLDWNGWSGERVVLRPDGTIPVARLYIDTMAEKELAKLFYVTNVFIFEATGKETRERWQCGAELIGVSSTVADVELITLALEVLKKLGLEGVGLRLSHAGLIRALLAGFGLSPREQIMIFDQILDGDVDALARVKPARPELERILTSLLDLKGKSSGFLKNFKALFPGDLPALKSSLDDFINIVGLLDALSYDYQIDLSTGRGFEYYTGVIFQFFAGEEKIGGGGRYDALIPLVGGKDVPASGFALYLDPLMNLVKSEALTKPLAPRILITAEPQVMKEGFSIANDLHEAGYSAELNLVGQGSADLRWTLDVRSKAPVFILIDRIKRRKFELETAGEVLARLKENR